LTWKTPVSLHGISRFAILVPLFRNNNCNFSHSYVYIGLDCSVLLSHLAELIMFNSTSIRLQCLLSFLTPLAVSVLLVCTCNSIAYGQKFIDVSTYMKMPPENFFIDTTGFSSIDVMSAAEISERSWAKMGFSAAIPISYDPAPTLSTFGSELSRDSMVAGDAASLFLYDTMYTRFGSYVWIFQDRDVSTNYATYEVRFENLVHCRDYDQFFSSLKYGMMGSALYPDAPVGVAENDAEALETTWIEVNRNDVLSFRSSRKLNGQLQLYAVNGAVSSRLDIIPVEGQKYTSVQALDCASGMYYLCSEDGFIAFVYLKH